MKKPKSQFQPVGNRYCSICQCSQPTKGGDWIISADKLKRKWHCGKHFEDSENEQNVESK